MNTSEIVYKADPKGEGAGGMDLIIDGNVYATFNAEYISTDQVARIARRWVPGRPVYYTTSRGTRYSLELDEELNIVEFLHD